MENTISVRIDKDDLKEINGIMKYDKITKAALLREIIDTGIKKKKLEIALKKYLDNDASIGKAAEIADISISEFMDVIKRRGINLHYDLEELREDLKDLI